MNDLDDEGTFVWTDGSTATYGKWAGKTKSSLQMMTYDRTFFLKKQVLNRVRWRNQAMKTASRFGPSRTTSGGMTPAWMKGNSSATFLHAIQQQQLLPVELYLQTQHTLFSYSFVFSTPVHSSQHWSILGKTAFSNYPNSDGARKARWEEFLSTKC